VAAFDVSVRFATEFIPSLKLSAAKFSKRNMQLAALSGRRSSALASSMTGNFLDESLFEHAGHDRASLTIPGSLSSRSICSQVDGDDFRMRPSSVMLEGSVKEEKEVVVSHGKSDIQVCIRDCQANILAQRESSACRFAKRFRASAN
jgi:hypothetical protein